MLVHYLFVVLLVVATSQANPIAPRSIQRSGRTGDVSLVEFAIHKTIHGRCSYPDKSGRSVKLIYEETEGAITAKSSNPSVVDVVAAVRECRAAAAEVPKATEIPEGRAGDVESGLSPYEINARLHEFARSNYENQQYVQHLQPRLITWLGQNWGNNLGSFSGGNTANSNFGLSWGNNAQSSNYPGINLMAPANQISQNSVTYGSSNPFDFLYGSTANSGPWGVLNSISNSNVGGFNGGFPGFFSFFNPFSGFG